MRPHIQHGPHVLLYGRLAPDGTVCYSLGCNKGPESQVVIVEQEPAAAYVQLSEPERLGLISRSELAAALMLNYRTLARWERRGVLPPPKLFGRAVFYDKSAVADRLSDNIPALWRVVARNVLAARHVTAAN
jgi:hypothetical protein